MMTMTPEEHDERHARHARKLAQIAAYIEEVALFAGYAMECCHNDPAVGEAMVAKVRSDPATFEWYRRQMETTEVA